MLIVQRNQEITFKILFVVDGEVYNPIDLSTPNDVLVNVIRGDSLSGAIISSPLSYLYSSATPNTNFYIEKNEQSEFIIHYKVPQGVFAGVYTLVAKTIKDGQTIVVESRFQVLDSIYEPNPTVPSGNKSSIVSYRPNYQDLSSSNNGSLLLIGHADNIQLNNPLKIKSIQTAIDILGADMRSPLLRGVLDAYDAGARDIFICAAAPMSEYIADVSLRNTQHNYFNLDQSTPSYQTFYEKYYERLQTTYSTIGVLDFIDVIVPLETSIIQTGSVDFITQLANYCRDFQNTTGFVQIGIIGSRTNGMSVDHIDTMEADNNLSNKYTTYDYSGRIISDKGRYVIPIYGEATFSHTFIQTTYVNSVAAAFAGLMVSSELNISLIRKRIPGAMSLFGSDFTTADIQRLENIGINTIFRNNKARRGTAFEVYVTNDYTMASLDSVFSKAPQLRLAALLSSELKSYSYDSIGRFGYDKVSSNTADILNSLKSRGIIRDFEFNIVPSETDKGSIIVYVSVISSLGLKKINLSISSGPGA